MKTTNWPIKLLVLLLPSLLHGADLLDQWTWRNPRPTGDLLRSVAYGNGRFVAISDLGSTLLSEDGSEWRFHRRDQLEWSMHDILFAEGRFLAVGGYPGPNGFSATAAFTSLDGISWKTHLLASPPPQQLWGVAYSAGRYVAVGSGGLAFTSTNGVDWSDPVTIGGFNGGTAFAVAGGGDQFVVVGVQGRIATSPDGMTWTARASGTRALLPGVTFGNGTFVAVGGSGTQKGVILTSSDGITWTSRSSGTDGLFRDVVFDQGRFVAVGGPDLIRWSMDGVVWREPETPLPLPTWTGLMGIGAGNGFFVTVGQGGDILSSTNGATWHSATSGERPGISLTGITYGGDQFVAVGYPQARANILTSLDGHTWTPRDTGISDLNLSSITHGSGQFVAAGSEGSIASSSNGVTWNRHASGTTFNLASVAYGNGTFVAIGNNTDFDRPQRTMLASSNGTNWHVQLTESGPWLTQVAYGAGQFVAVGNDGTITSSSDGTVWTARPSGGSNYLSCVAFGNRRFVVPGLTNVLTSPDGIHWTSHPSDTMYGATCITFGAGLFVAPYIFDSVSTSRDGISWTSRWTGASLGATAIAYGNGQFISAGGVDALLGCDVRPRLEVFQNSPTGERNFSSEAVTGLPYVLESSTNLKDWSPVMEATAVQGEVRFVDRTAQTEALRVYRVSFQE